MATIELDPSIPTWARQFQEELTGSLTNTLTNIATQLYHKIDDIVESNAFQEASIKEASKASSDAIKSTKILEDHIQQQAKQIADAEVYSKGYNIKFFNVPDNHNETISMLQDKHNDISSMVDIDLSHIYNIHRLPTYGKGPKPIKVKFVSKLDRSNVWKRRRLLGQKGSNIYIREHFNTATERNIHTLLPIRRHAIIQNKESDL